MKLKNILILVTLFLSLNSKAFGAKASSGSSGVGNGGDPIRDAFILIGKNILKNYESGFIAISGELSKQNINDYKELSAFLTIDTIQTSATELYDNKGSVVSAIGIPGSITLYVGDQYPDLSWGKILLNIPKSERLVLHELLRSAGVNDDNFIYTNTVLKNQGRMSNGKFNFIWSKNNDALINSALSNSFESIDYFSEIKIFRDFSQTFNEQNTSRNSEFIKVYFKLIILIDSSLGENQSNEILSAYRDTVKNLKLVNDSIDQFAIHALKADGQEEKALAKYFILSLRQVQSRSTQFQGIEKNILLDYLNSLILLCSTNEYTGENFINLKSSLQELVLSIKKGSDHISVNMKLTKIIKVLQRI